MFSHDQLFLFPLALFVCHLFEQKLVAYFHDISSLQNFDTLRIFHCFI
jgi:hypothetical protein